MTSLLSGIEQPLFFTDVPDGTLKHKPAVRNCARDVGDVIGNLGADIHNALFFDDLQSIAKQNAPKDPYEEKGCPKKAFVPLAELGEDEPRPFPEDDDETSVQIECRGKTIPPPSLARLQRLNEERAVTLRQKELLGLV